MTDWDLGFLTGYVSLRSAEEKKLDIKIVKVYIIVLSGFKFAQTARNK